MHLPLDTTLERIAHTPGVRWWSQSEQLRHLRIVARMAGSPSTHAMSQVSQLVINLGWQLQAPDIGFRPLRPHMPWTLQQRARSTLFRAWAEHWDTLDWAAVAGEGTGMGWLALDWFMELGSVAWKRKSLEHEVAPPRGALGMLWWQALSVSPLEAVGANIPAYRMTHALATGLACGWDVARNEIRMRSSPQRLARLHHWCGVYDMDEVGPGLENARLLLGQEALEDYLNVFAQMNGDGINRAEQNGTSARPGLPQTRPEDPSRTCSGPASEPPPGP